ncbi:MAG: LamG domain-containing protein, partial [Candidatus Pacebacteria bacterium]|nr:LamG domain-containing protein [Candidatus Paceibacterota bacterium]
VAYWKMDESSWATTSIAAPVLDSSGNGNNGTPYNHASPTSTAKFGMAGNFDGADDYVIVPTPTGIESAGTISMWVYTDYPYVNGTDNYFFVSGFSTNYKRIIFNYYDTGLDRNLHLIFGQSGEVDTTYNAPTSGWVFLTFTWVGGNISTYADGVFISTLSRTALNGVAASTYLGGDSNYVRHKGKLDDVKIYNKARTAEQIRRDYETGPPPVAHWKMDENTGQTAYDITGNGNTGTLGAGATADASDPQWTNGQYGSALKFDGVDDYASVANTISNVKTVEFWVNDSNANDGLLELVNNDTYISIASNAIATTNFASPTIYVDGVANKTAITSGWHHIAITTHATTTGITANSIVVGEANNDFTSGFIDDVRIYNYARTPKQIMEDMLGSPVGSYSLYLPFDEGQGDIAYDKSINKNNGDLYGACPGAAACPTWTTNGKFGKALSFDGGDYVSVPDNAMFNTKSFTVCAWARPASFSDYQNILAKQQDASFEQFGFLVGSSQGVGFQLGDGASGCSQKFTLNTWAYICGSTNGTVSRMYFNGQLCGQGTDNSSYSATKPLIIGSTQYQGGSRYFNGLIDEVKFYTFELSPAEIKLEYNRGASLKLGSASGPSAVTSSDSASLAYCVPGDTSACAAPVAHWKMDEMTGQYTNDTSGKSNTGTLGTGSTADSADPTWKISSCHSGSCLSFDGANDYVHRATFSSVPSTNMTVSAWVKTSSITKQFVVAQGRRPETIDGEYVYSIEADGTQLFWDYNTNYGYANTGTSTTNVADGKWHHIAFVKSGVNGTYYLDGRVDGTKIAAANRSYIADDFVIGKDYRGDSAFFNGLIDDVRIYNYARTPAQIAWDYNRGGPIAWWRMDDGQDTATTCDGTVSTVSDSSGNGNTGALESAGSPATSTMWVEGKYSCALDFDGTDDYISIGDISDVATGTLSLSFWAKPDTTTQKLIELTASDYVELSSGVVSVTGFGTETIYIDGKQTTVFPDTNWHHIVVVSTANITANAINLGKNSSTYYDGLLDDARIYNYALNATQIKQIYNQGAAVRFGPVEGLP